ncbi:hypothetical protein DV515_00009278, partial [Chloebia gouldiae]
MRRLLSCRDSSRLTVVVCGEQTPQRWPVVLECGEEAPALPDFKFAEFLAIAIGAGGDTPWMEVVQVGRLCPLALKMLFGYP